MARVKVRKGMPSVAITKAEFVRRARERFFDPAFEPTVTTKNPPAGKDIIQASANTFYRGVTLDDMKTFRERYPLNSRVVKSADNALREDIYRAGTPDGTVPAGLYAVYLKKAIEYLQNAVNFWSDPVSRSSRPMFSTTAVYTKRPIIIDGTPASTSTRKRIPKPRRPRPYSAR